jgi:MFS-type transporter involved in bile tolerance (Atg22 family)
VATATDLFLGGMLVDALIRRGWNASRVRQTAIVAGTACGLGILGAMHARHAPAALLWISVSIGGLAAAAPVGWSVPGLIAPAGSVGKVGGIVNFVCQISGITAEILTGYILRATRSYSLAFGIAAAYLALGILGYLFLLGRIEPMRARPQSRAA